MTRLLTVFVGLGLAAAAQAANPFRCDGFTPAGDRAMTIRASGQSITQIKNLNLDWFNSWPVKIQLPLVEKSEKYKPRSPRYAGLEKWVVDVSNGPACKWDLLLPPAAKRGSAFRGYSQTACDSYYETIVLKCTAN